MTPLDMRTVILGDAVSCFLCTVVVGLLWVQNRTRYQGLGFWLADFAMQLAALVLVALRGTVPDLLSMTGSNTLVVGGTVVLFIGLEHFVGRRGPQLHNWVLVGAYAAVHAYFAVVRPDLTTRSVLLSLALLAICSQCAWLLLLRVGRELRPVTRVVGAIFALICLVSVFRLPFDLLRPSPQDFFHSGTSTTVAVFAYGTAFVALTFGLVLMVNRRLVEDLRLDIAARRRAEEVQRQLSHDLGERVKELRCLYRISELTSKPALPLEQILQGVVDLVPSALQHAEAACARLSCEGRSHSTGNYRDTPWKQTSEILVEGVPTGRLEVCYLEEKPAGDEGPFLKEERLLIDAVAERVGRIVERKRAEDALRLSEEKFHKAFHSSPDAVVVSRLADGAVVEVNERFCRMSEHSREECLARTTETLGFWADPGDRQRVVAALRQDGSVRDLEVDLRSRSGKRITGLYSGEVISLDGEAHALSMVHDITEQRQAQTLLRLRLELWELAAAHSVGELMQKALDEIGELTGSPIGFYHFVDEDRGSLLLQAWSTRTRAEFCQAEAEGMHYPISEAGVWVDAFHQQRPVIHNDYAALPHRKGLPEGHAAVVRELVVPVIRSGRVVAILGVGNKASDYDESDVRLVSYVADVVWTIVAQKLSEDEIRQLNTQLERLATTDELTGLANRRAFFARGEEEIRRARRFKSPFSLLMLDLDHFKRVNDTYGHEAGDRALRCVVSRVRAQIREVDLLARLGGEEFGVLVTNVPGNDAVVFGERLRQAVEREPCDVGEATLPLTVSVGVSTFDPAITDLDAMLRLADKALYKAKSEGRNRVVFG